MRKPESFREVLNGRVVDPADRQLALSETLRLLLALQRQEDSNTAYDWRDSSEPAEAYEVLEQNGILKRVYSGIARILAAKPTDYDMRRRAAGRLFNEMALCSQKAKLPDTLTLLSGKRTLALYSKLYPDADILSVDGFTLAGLMLPVNDPESTESKTKIGVSIPDSVALTEEETGVVKVSEIHEYSTSGLVNRTYKKYAGYKRHSSPAFPEVLPPDATFVFVSLTGNNTTDKIAEMVKEYIPDPRMRAEILELTFGGFRQLVSTFIDSYKPHYRASPLRVMERLNSTGS